MEFTFQYKTPPGNAAERLVCNKALKVLSELNTEWDSLSPRQYFAIMGVLNSELPLPDQLIQCTYIIMQQPWDKMVDLFVKNFLTLEQIMMATELCKFIVNKDRNLNKNHLPQLKLGRTKYRGPADGMADITFSQFMDADHLLCNAEKVELSHFAKLASILYLPKNEQYSPVKAKKRINKFSKLPKNQLYGIGFFFSSVKSQWVKLLPNLFVSSGASGGSTTNWATPLQSISKDPTQMQANAQQPAFNVLHFIDQRISEQKEAQKKSS